MQGIRKMMPGNEGQFEVSMGGMMLLGGTTTLVTAIAFLLGIYVGKGITEERLASEQHVVKYPVGNPELPESDEPTKLSFWDRIEAEDAARAKAAVTPATTRAEPTERSASEPTATRAPSADRRPTAPAASILSGVFRVQVQALADKLAAEEIAENLRDSGYLVTISAAEVDGKTLYRVRVGPYSTEEQARIVIEKLRRLGFSDAFLNR